MDPLQQVFSLLTQWRDLPSYQLERRADIFFAVYLARVLEKKTGLKIAPLVIPEFPLKQEGSNLSKKADYLLLTQDKRLAFLVELKTDMGSRSAEQDSYLHAAQQLGLRELLRGLLSLWEASAQKQKYYHAARLLDSLGLMELPSGLEATLFPEVRARAFYEKLSQVKTTQTEIAIQRWYVQPLSSGEEGVIDFAFFAEAISGLDDELSEHFRACLRRWTTPAGSRLVEQDEARAKPTTRDET